MRRISGAGVEDISLADTIGSATPELIGRVVRSEFGVHLHSRREEAARKIVAAYDAGCRRFDRAMGGFGGCPFAQDDLVGNIPTEEVLSALAHRGADVPSGDALANVAKLNRAIADEFSHDSDR